KADGSSDVTVLPGLGDLQQSYLPGAVWYDRKVQAYNAILTAKLGSVDLTAISGYSINAFSDSFDTTSSSFTASRMQTLFGVQCACSPGVAWVDNNKTKKFTEEVRLSVPIGQRVEWLLGGFYTDENSQYTIDFLGANPTTGAVVGNGLH